MKKIVRLLFSLALVVLPVKVFAASHHITFDANGGTPSSIAAIDKEDGEEFEVPEVSKDGVTFAGWYYEDESMPVDSPGRFTPLEGNQVKNYWPTNINFVAKWVAKVNTINITVDLPVGTEVSSTKPISESVVKVPSDAKYSAYPEGAGLIKSYDSDEAFEGTIEAGKEYYIELMVLPDESVFAADTVIKVNGKTTFVINKNYVDSDGKLNSYSQNSGFLMYAKVVAGKSTEDDGSNKDGSNKTENASVTDAKTVTDATSDAIAAAASDGKATTGIDEATAAAIKEAKDAGKTITSALIANPLTDTDVSDTVKEKVAAAKSAGATILGYYDIQLKVLADGTSIGNITALKEGLKVTIDAKDLVAALPAVASGKTRTFKIVRIHDGEATILDATLNDDNTISFVTDKFSDYIITYEDVDATKNPNTLDNVSLYMMLAIGSLGIMVILFLNRKRFN